MRKSDADEWAVQAARDIGSGKKPARRARGGAPTFGHLIDLHISDLTEVRKPLRRSKDHVLRRLKEDIGDTPITELTKPELIKFGRSRAKERAGPQRSPSTSASSAP